MDITSVKCEGCGSSLMDYDPKTRKLICQQCGKVSYYARSALNRDGNVTLSKNNAMRFFKEGKIENAQHYSMDVLNFFSDNAPALYILSYFDEFVKRKNNSMSSFFKAMNEIVEPLEYDEIHDLIDLFKQSNLNLLDYEFDILMLLIPAMGGEDDIQDLAEFVDFICPTFIKRRSTITYLKADHSESYPNQDKDDCQLASVYRQLAEYCGIPKTCYMLIKSIQTNHDSPFVMKNFYLKSRSRFFYENYVLPIGEIVNGMKENESKGKLVAFYNKTKNQFEQNLAKE